MLIGTAIALMRTTIITVPKMAGKIPPSVFDSRGSATLKRSTRNSFTFSARSVSARVVSATRISRPCTAGEPSGERAAIAGRMGDRYPYFKGEAGSRIGAGILANLTIYWVTRAIGPAMQGYYDFGHFQPLPPPGTPCCNAPGGMSRRMGSRARRA